MSEQNGQSVVGQIVIQQLSSGALQVQAQSRDPVHALGMLEMAKIELTKKFQEQQGPQIVVPNIRGT